MAIEIPVPSADRALGAWVADAIALCEPDDGDPRGHRLHQPRAHRGGRAQDALARQLDALERRLS